MKGKWLLAAGIAVLIGIGAGAISWYRTQQQPAVKPAAATDTAPAPGSEVSLAGKIEALNVVPVPAPVDGTLEIWHVDIGEEVYEGQLLASIKNTQLESARDKAAAELETVQTRINNMEGELSAARLEASRAAAEGARAKGEYERQNKLFQRQQLLYREGATPRLVFEKTQREFESATAEYDTARAVLEQAEERVRSLVRDLDAIRKTLEDKREELENTAAELAGAEVHAPVDGIVNARRVEQGTAVTRDMQDLVQLATDLGALQVVVEPPPSVVSRLRPGQEAIVQVAEAANEALPGSIKEINEGRVVVTFASPNPAVRPGLTAQVRLRLI
jgi:multidrug resistance efflux pump